MEKLWIQNLSPHERKPTGRESFHAEEASLVPLFILGILNLQKRATHRLKLYAPAHEYSKRDTESLAPICGCFEKEWNISI